MHDTMRGCNLELRAQRVQGMMLTRLDDPTAQGSKVW